MKILLCGAADVRDVLPQFNDVMDEMSFESNNYIDGTLGATNGNDWGENSKEAVENAHLVVFVLIVNAGEITWKTEYTTAVDSGKPYILLCETKLADHYYDIVPDKTIKVSRKNIYNDAKAILDRLVTEKRNIVRFSLRKADFKNILKRQINYELERATAQLQKHNKNKTVLARIKNRNYKKLLIESVSSEHLQHFKDILFDQFENKEVRKRVLYYFTLHKNLSDDEIIELFDDAEQGISRMLIENLPNTLTSSNDREKIIKALISFIKDSTDVGIVRRAIGSIFEIDIEIGLKHIFDIFPANDIGTPKRIVSWLNEHKDDLLPYLKRKEFRERLERLATMCKGYDSKPQSLDMLVDELMNMLKNNI